MLVEIPQIGIDGAFPQFAFSANQEEQVLSDLFRAVVPAFSVGFHCETCPAFAQFSNLPGPETLSVKKVDTMLLIRMQCKRAKALLAQKTQGRNVARNGLGCSEGAIVDLQLFSQPHPITNPTFLGVPISQMR